MNHLNEIKDTITGAHKLKILGRGEELFFKKGISAFLMVLVLLSCQCPSGHKSKSASTSGTTKTAITRDDQE